MILVTGPTDRIGSSVIRRLREPDRRVDARNVGYLLAELAAADRTHEPLLRITRPEAMNFASMAVHLSHQLARDVRYVDCTPSNLLRCAEAADMEPWRAHDTVNWQTEARTDRRAIVHNTLERLTAYAPTCFSTLSR